MIANIFLADSPISWKTKKQGSVSLSSAEAEYHSLQRVTAELTWLTRLLHELGVSDVVSIPVKCDNQSVIYIARNPIFHERTKLIEIDCHFVRDKIQQGLVDIVYTHTCRYDDLIFY